LIPGAPADPNPTLTPAQAAVAVDDLDWYYATREGPGRGLNGVGFDLSQEVAMYPSKKEAWREGVKSFV